jgi:hypothetical protein
MKISWLKNCNKKEDTPFVYEHEVLKTLRKFGMTIIQTGNDEDGYKPFDKFQLATGFLQYGTLVDLIFNPDKYKGNNGVIAQNITTKRSEVGISIDKWNLVNKAIEILEINGDVKDVVEGEFTDIKNRKVYITAKGLQSLNTDFYIREYKREKYTDEFHKSQVTTNFWMKWGTISIAIATFIGALSQIKSCISQTKQKNITMYFQQSIISRSSSLDTSQINHIYMKKVVKELESNLDSNIELNDSK